MLTGTCASIGYSTSCCPWSSNPAACRASDGNCNCGADCHLPVNNDCCSDVACPSSPTMCTHVGIYGCCNGTPAACEVRNSQDSCFCDMSCRTRGDCCPDACVPQTCAGAGKHRGCCKTSQSSSCYVPGGTCYCDKYCFIFSDCCIDVVQQQCNNQITDPPSGSLIADFEGAINSTIISCDIVNRTRDQINTEWNVTNLRGVSSFQTLSSNLEFFHFSGDPIPGTMPTQTFRNRLIVLNMTNDLDRVTLSCGSNIFPTQAHFFFRIYRPPKLRKMFYVRIQEGDTEVTIDLDQDHVPFPEPSIFNWSKDGQPLSDDNNIVSLTYSNVTFLLVTRNISGNYTVSATNFLLDNASQQLGSDVGSFHLDVLYPPSFITEGPTHRYALLGDSASLVCGTGLDSNPQATIIWTTPDGTTVVNNARYDLDNGQDIIQLNITRTALSDAGIWRCDVMVSSEAHKLNGGRLTPQNNVLIGSVNVTIQLIIIVPPGQPSIPIIESSGTTWAFISWTAPLMADFSISHYEILARAVDHGKMVTMETDTNVTYFNVTGLLPGTTYELTVVAVSQGGVINARSVESDLVVFMQAQTCAGAGKHRGCCQTSPSSSCYVPGGTCYCDKYCLIFDDCCIDVVRQQCNSQISDPPSGSLIVDFEGAKNATIISCEIVNITRDQINTEWSVTNFRGVSTFQILSNNPEIFYFSGDPIPGTMSTQTFRSRLTILNMTNDLDRVTIFCGGNTFPAQSHFLFRIYRPPKLRKTFNVRIQEGDTDVTIDLGQDPAPFPEPGIFNWSMDGQPLLDDNITSLTFSNVTFSLVTRNISGNYTVSATNFLLDNTSQQIGSDVGSFHLDVLYPPSFITEGPTHHYALLGDSASLVCGTGLDSNPQATITWIAPDGITVVDNARYNLDNGPELIQLNITHTALSDAGIWQCDVMVSSEANKLNGGRLTQQNNVFIGSVNVTIQLTIIVPPGQPSIPMIESSGTTWAVISWTAPLGADSSISYYEIIARAVDRGKMVTMETNTNATSFNVTGLIPGTTYELTVVAVSQEGDINARSVESDSVIFGVIRQVTEQGFEVGALLGAISGILILIIILIFTVAIIIFWLRKRAIRNKTEAVNEDPVRTGSPQLQPQNLTMKASDVNSSCLELEQCPAYVNASLK